MSDLSQIREQLKALEAQHAALLQHHAVLQRQHSGLQQQHTDLQQKCATLTQELKAAIEKAAEFETLFKDLFEKVFGRRSERFEDPDQLQIEFPTTPEQLADAIDGEVTQFCEPSVMRVKVVLTWPPTLIPLQSNSDKSSHPLVQRAYDRGCPTAQRANSVGFA